MAIVTVGKALINDRLFDINSAALVDWLELGTGNTAVAAGDTALGTAITGDGLARAASTQSQSTTTTTNDSGVLTHTWTASGSQTVKEAGSFNASSSGTMLHREVLGTARALTSGSTYTYTLTLVIA